MHEAENNSGIAPHLPDAACLVGRGCLYLLAYSDERLGALSWSDQGPMDSIDSVSRPHLLSVKITWQRHLPLDVDIVYINAE